LADPTIDLDQFQKDVEIGGDLDQGFRKQAGLFAHYAVQHYRAVRQEASAKILMEVTEAQVDKELRDDAIGDDTKPAKKITDKSVEASIARDIRYVKAQRAYNEAKALASLANNALEAFKQRRDMLIQLGASEREEMKGEMSMRGRGAAESAHRAAATEALARLS
jgi:hypothetical protein